MDKILSIPMGWTISLFVVVGALLYVTIIERFWLEVRWVDVTMENLPQDLSGIRIVQFSDVHLGFYYSTQNLHELVNQINELKPDVICFTGDLLDSAKAIGSIGEVTQELARLKAAYGKFAVLGNHDYRTGADLIEENVRSGGFQVLVNEAQAIDYQGARLHLVGVDDVLHGHPDLSIALRNVPEKEPTILLVHEPDYAVTSSKHPIQLQLSGHSHGGQVRLPFGGPILTSTLGKTYNAGLYRLGRLTIYTNRGIGTTILPVRFFSRPEISVITLRRKNC